MLQKFKNLKIHQILTTLILLFMEILPLSSTFQHTHGPPPVENMNLHPMNPRVVSSETATTRRRPPEHQLRKHNAHDILTNFRNFEHEFGESESPNRYLDSGGMPLQDQRIPIFPTPYPEMVPMKKYDNLFEVDFPAYPPKLDDLFAGNPIKDTARCFSCMSKFYEAVWPVLSTVYKRPRNFTDRCNEEIIDSKSVPVVQCSTICVQMWEEPTVAGVKIRGHIRGCLDDLLHNGFNQTIVTWYRWMHRDSCRQYRKRELFKLPPDQSDDSLVNVCTCYADYCNTTPARTSTCSALKILHSISVLIAVLFWRIR